MNRAVAHRLLALGVSSLCVLGVCVLAEDGVARDRALLGLLCCLGWGHLLAPMLALQRVSRVDRLHLAVAAVSALLLFATLAEHAPSLASVLAVMISAWHFVENDHALGPAYRQNGRMPRLSPRVGVRPAVLFVALGLIAFLATSLDARSGVLVLFVLGSLHHVFCWIGLTIHRALAERRRSDPAAAWRLRTLVFAHAWPASLGTGLWLFAAPEALARELFFSPGLYLFASSLHVVQTAWLRMRA